MTIRRIEDEFEVKANDAPRVTPADIEANIASEFYFTAAQGAECGRMMEPRLSEQPLPLALRLADALENVSGNHRSVAHQAAAELRRQHAEIEEWRTKAAAWLASPEAAQRLEGYRELGRLAEKAETERDALRDELREATAATNDPAVNNLRTLPESIQMLRAERDELLDALGGYRREIGLLTGVPDEQPDDTGRDWSLLEATQKSLREHMAIIQKYTALLRQALWALEAVDNDAHGTSFPATVSSAITDLRAALEQAHGIGEEAT